MFFSATKINFSLGLAFICIQNVQRFISLNSVPLTYCWYFWKTLLCYIDDVVIAEAAHENRCNLFVPEVTVWLRLLNTHLD